MHEVDLKAVLAAKEQRSAIRDGLIAAWGLPVVSITLNMPGRIKNSPPLRQLLRHAATLFREQAEREGLTIAEERMIYADGGPAALFAVDGAPVRLKRLGVDLETRSSYARLLDIDVFDAAGLQISRSHLALPVRKCFVCEEEALACRRSGRHDQREILRQADSWLASFAAEATNCWPEAVWEVGARAVEAMLMEAACTPAPGLVDRRNAGAHQDMDYFLFLKSSSALAGTMFRCAAAGWSHDGSGPALLPVLRRIGADGEAKMFRATAAVNTQKGLLFLQGVLAAAAAGVLRDSRRPAASSVCQRVAAICQGLVERELEPLRRMPLSRKATAGEKLFLEYGVTGIRGEMEAGLPNIANLALPCFRDALSAGLSLNDALVQALLALMTVAEDTTVLNRHGPDVLREVQALAGSILSGGGMLTESGRREIAGLDQLFIARRISPGGAADLLAATYFIHLIDSEAGPAAD